jgi:hypothetical protein
MPNLESLRKNIAHLNDEALLEVNPDELTEEAKAVYEEELASRGLSWESSDEDALEVEVEADGAEAAAPIPDLAPDDIVKICTFETLAEASFALSLLRQEQIPVWLGGSKSRKNVKIDPNAPLDLHTMPEFLEAAEMLLNTEISDEELARMAEEAGQPE